MPLPYNFLTSLLIIDEKHYASAEIEEQLRLLKSKWEKLLDITNIKKSRLEEAYQALLFGRMLDEFCLWMDEVNMIKCFFVRSFLIA